MFFRIIVTFAVWFLYPLSYLSAVVATHFPFCSGSLVVALASKENDRKTAAAMVPMVYVAYRDFIKPPLVTVCLSVKLSNAGSSVKSTSRAMAIVRADNAPRTKLSLKPDSISIEKPAIRIMLVAMSALPTCSSEYWTALLVAWPLFFA